MASINKRACSQFPALSLAQRRASRYWVRHQGEQKSQIMLVSLRITWQVQSSSFGYDRSKQTGAWDSSDSALKLYLNVFGSM
jgi:hypothetical protein